MRLRYLLIPLLILAALAGGAYAYVQNHQTVGPLTGQPVSKDIANRRPVAVMFDNYSPDARPQSGLDRASLIFETLAEGGITRFMGVYLEHDAPTVGPVRSTRYYFNSWAAMLGVIFGHDGGNVDALQQLKSLDTIYNVDADKTPQPFTRISSRQIPHNEYTSTPGLRSYAQLHGGSITGSRMSLLHKSDAPLSQRPASSTINIQFSYGDYNVTWKYDRSTNRYLRFMGGVTHVEATTGKQLAAKNVVVMFSKETQAPDPFTPGAIHMQTEGSGQATVYEDGKAIKGTWQKSSVDGPLRWVDSSGHGIKLNRGVTWVEVVPTGNTVTAG